MHTHTDAFIQYTDADVSTYMSRAGQLPLRWHLGIMLGHMLFCSFI